MAKKIGFHISGVFIYALPTETHDDRMRCVRLSRELNLDMIRFNNATPYPGTAFYHLALKSNNLNIQGSYENFNSVSTIIENPFRKIPFSYIPDGSSENEIRNDILFSYLAFYFNINKIKMMMFSKNEAVMRWFNPGKKLLDLFLKSQ